MKKYVSSMSCKTKHQLDISSFKIENEQRKSNIRVFG